MEIKLELLKNQYGFYRMSINDTLITNDSCNGICTIIYSYIVELDKEGNVVKIKRKGE